MDNTPLPSPKERACKRAFDDARAGARSVGWMLARAAQYHGARICRATFYRSIRRHNEKLAAVRRQETRENRRESSPERVGGLTLDSRQAAVLAAEGERLHEGRTAAWAVERAAALLGRPVSRPTYYRTLIEYR